MIFAMARLALFGALVLGALYFLVSIYSRSVRTERLEREWERVGQPGPRDAYVKAGLAAYDASLRRKAILLIFIVPPIVVGAIIYTVNF